MRTLTACFLTLGIGFMAPPALAMPSHDGEPSVAVRGAMPSAFAPARPPPDAPKQSRPIDLDGDGIVSEAEARAYYAWLFGLLDRDGDGVVTRLEFITALGPRKGPITLAQRSAFVERLGVLFARLDKDGDEEISAREFMAACDNHFAGADVDGDGVVTLEEFTSRNPL